MTPAFVALPERLGSDGFRVEQVEALKAPAVLGAMKEASGHRGSSWDDAGQEAALAVWKAHPPQDVQNLVGYYVRAAQYGIRAHLLREETYAGRQRLRRKDTRRQREGERKPDRLRRDPPAAEVRDLELAIDVLRWEGALPKKLRSFVRWRLDGNCGRSGCDHGNCYSRTYASRLKRQVVESWRTYCASASVADIASRPCHARVCPFL